LHHRLTIITEVARWQTDPHNDAAIIAAGRIPIGPLARRFATLGDAADVIGITRRTLERWVRSGVTLASAERLADRVGEHPSMFGAPYLSALDAWANSRPYRDDLADLNPH
jgi:hypothetical protein